jgi:asparagine synthase (glutamine-hydrolysing)
MITLIAGIVSLDGNVPGRDQVSAMLDAMNPQGRDQMREIGGSGPALFGAMSMAAGGAARITPPAILSAGEDIFVADAMLWDRAPMAAAGETSDAVWIARVVREQGRAGLAGLHGDFAFARWNGGRLELARDHFGARPLQFTAKPGKWLAFASLPGALLRTGLASRALDTDSLLHYIPKDTARPGRSYYADISAVRPAHLTTVGPDGKSTAERYWRVPIRPRLSFDADPAAVFAEMRRLLDQAVRRRLPAEGPAAGHLSGGIDSTPICALAARAICGEGRRFLAYSFQERQADHDFDLVDEEPYAVEAAAAEPNIDHVPVFDQGEFKSQLDGFDLDIFEPASDRVPERQVLADAASKGAETLLSGWGGDQMASFHPIGYLAELFVHGRWLRCLRELRRVRRTRRRHGMRASYPGLIYYMIVLMLLPERWRQRLRRLTGHGLDEPVVRLRFVPAQHAGSELESEPGFPPHSRTFEWRRVSAERWFIAHRLELFAQLGAPFGIRYAYPLLDLDLVRFVMSLPGWFLAHEGGFRTLLRDPITGLVPESVSRRTVKLFPFPLEAIRMAEQVGALDARLATVDPGGAAADVIDIAALRQALSADVATPDTMWRILREHAGRGEQYYMPAYGYLNAVHLAIALEQYDREFGVRYGSAAP